jgi:hypothetical protein
LFNWIVTTIEAKNQPYYVTTKGFVGSWSFCGNSNDLSGNNYRTLNAETNLVPDSHGNSIHEYRLIGSSSYITIPLNSVQIATFSVWVKINGNNKHCGNPSGDDSVIISRISDWQSDFINFSAGGCSLSSGNSILVGSIGKIYSMMGVGTPITYPRPTQWLNIVWTIKGGFKRICIYGVLTNGTPYPGAIPTSYSGLTFEYLSNWGYPLNGDLDDIGIWNRSLTQQEITALYNRTNRVPPVTRVTASGPTSFFSGGSLQVYPAINHAYKNQWQKTGINNSWSINLSCTANTAGSYMVMVRQVPVLKTIQHNDPAKRTTNPAF